MPLFVLKGLECAAPDASHILGGSFLGGTEDATGSDECYVLIGVDGLAAVRRPVVGHTNVNSGQRWVLNESFPFQNQVNINLYDKDVDASVDVPLVGWHLFTIDSDDDLGSNDIPNTLVHRAKKGFTGNGAAYTLWYEVIDPNEGHRLTNISLRQMLSRLGRGVLTEQEYKELIESGAIYRCSEPISVRETLQFHSAQDGEKGRTNSIKTWIGRHCNPWGEDSVIPFNAIPNAIGSFTDALSGNLWKHIRDEQTYCVAGLQYSSWPVADDNPFNHETMDWCFNQILDPQFMYMLDYTSNTIKEERSTSRIEFPYIHNEIESGSLPVQWRPFCGEYVTTYGRNIYDIGHIPVKAEIHPSHTIVREHTTAAPMGDGGAVVPVNRAIIGMGLSGGFPGNVTSRWTDEVGGVPGGIWGDTTACWVTNLKKHPLRFKFYPPVARPSPSAQLKWRIVPLSRSAPEGSSGLAEYIQVSNWDQVDDFLELCQEDDPAGGALGFRDWDRSQGRPVAFTPQEAPLALQPKFTLKRDSYLEVEIDLTSASGIPVGYYAIVECGWSEKGPHTIYGFDVTFETVKAIKTSDWEHWHDWHLYYGVNGQWKAWWTANFVVEGDTYRHDTTFRIYTVDDMPISIRDCGIEWGGTDNDNEHLDRVSITAHGPDHFESAILAGSNLVDIYRKENTLRFNVQGDLGGGKTKHEWAIQIVRFL